MTRQELRNKYYEIAKKNGDPIKPKEIVDKEIDSIIALSQILIKEFRYDRSNLYQSK